MALNDLDDLDRDDVVSALRMAASQIEMTALALVAVDLPMPLRPVQVALRKKAARYRKLAARLARGTGSR